MQKRLVVVIDPGAKTATVFRPGAASVVVELEMDVLDLSDVITRFRCSLHEIFQ